MNVIPVLIIDSCYSGIAGQALHIEANDMIRTIHTSISSVNATKYAVFCACTDSQYAMGNRKGGIFSQVIFDIIEGGLNTNTGKRNPILYIQDIF